MSAIIDGFVYCFRKNLDYGQRLVADLDDEQMVLQPTPPHGAAANHPAWVLSHLNAYLPIIADLIQGQPFDDPKQHRFGMLSKPESDRSIYDTKRQLLSTFVNGHEKAIELLTAAGVEALEQSVKLPRWVSVMPVVGVALPYLMLNHENMHLGQVSAWRRIQGMASV